MVRADGKSWRDRSSAFRPRRRSANDTRLQIPGPLLSSPDLLLQQGFYLPGRPPQFPLSSHRPFVSRSTSVIRHIRVQATTTSTSTQVPTTWLIGHTIRLYIYLELSTTVPLRCTDPTIAASGIILRDPFSQGPLS